MENCVSSSRRGWVNLSQDQFFVSNKFTKVAEIRFSLQMNTQSIFCFKFILLKKAKVLSIYMNVSLHLVHFETLYPKYSVTFPNEMLP